MFNKITVLLCNITKHLSINCTPCSNKACAKKAKDAYNKTQVLTSGTYLYL